MSIELHTLITKLIPPGRGIHLTEVTIEDKSVRLQLTAIAPTSVEQLCQVDAGVARANQLIQAFLAIARQRRGHELEAWMAEATHRGIDKLAPLARGLQEDLAAVTAGLTLEWSNGVTEGQIHRLKLTKRQGYGRAEFALLRQRVLQVAEAYA